jgi:hypothetical protein
MKPIGKEKITPIRRKGCKNVGWIGEKRQYEDGSEYIEKIIVPLHKGKPTTFISKVFNMERFEMKNVLFINNKLTKTL